MCLVFSLAGPLAVIDGYSSPLTPRNVPSPTPKSPPPPVLPPLGTQDKAKFNGMFAGCGPVNGIISGEPLSSYTVSSPQPFVAGEKARSIFVRSKLPVDKLSQIWYDIETTLPNSIVIRVIQELGGYPEAWLSGCYRFYDRYVLHTGYNVWNTSFHTHHPPPRPL